VLLFICARFGLDFRVPEIWPPVLGVCAAPLIRSACGSRFWPVRFLFADPVREGSVLGQLQCFFELQVHAPGLRSGLLFFDCIARTGFQAKVSRSSTARC
jgi:hypothetical protein